MGNRDRPVSSPPGRPRSFSEGALFQNSYDYTVPYVEHGGKNGAELALEMLGAQESPFNVDGKLRVPLWLGSAMSYPPSLLKVSSDHRKEASETTKKAMLRFGLPIDVPFEGFEELVALGASLDYNPSTYLDLSDTHLVADPSLISEFIEDKLIPEEHASLPPERIAKLFHLGPLKKGRSSRRGSSQLAISYTVNSEGRKIIEHATLAEVIAVFSSEAQGTPFKIAPLLVACIHGLDSPIKPYFHHQSLYSCLLSYNLARLLDFVSN